MSEDHEMDRRFQDQAFKLDITREISEVKSELRVNSAETKETKVDLKSFHEEFNRAIYGGIADRGLIGQAQDNAHEIKSLKNLILKGFPVILFVVLFFGEQLNPIIKDWIYEKTHLKIFASPAESFKKEKATIHVKHYTIIQKPDLAPGN